MKYVFLFLLLSTSCFAQQTTLVDFQKISATITPLTATKSVAGAIRVQFLVKKDTDSLFMDAINMHITNTALESVKVAATKDKIWLTGTFQQGKQYTAFFEYEATPKQTLYFTGDQIWTQGQGKYTSHWLPSIDDMNDKIEFDLTIVAPKGKRVVANGKLVTRNASDFVTGKHQFDMQKPMSSYLVAFAMGNYSEQNSTSDSGIPIKLYLPTIHQKKFDSLWTGKEITPKNQYEYNKAIAALVDTTHFEPTYRHTKAIFDFLEKEIGVAYPWQNYKQVPVRDFLYAGMENTGCTIFSEAFIVDEIGFNDRNYVNVNAHELAHQWFGNLITETSGTHHWLQEGFATYYALLAERQIFGDDYYYWKLYQTAEQLKALSDEGKGESLLNPGASSLTFYEKGAWALHLLQEEIGDASFQKAIKNYLSKHQFGNVTTEDFLFEVRAVTEIDISAWEKDWLQQSAFKAEQAFNSLLKSSFIRNYFNVARLAALPLDQKTEQLSEAMATSNDYVGQEVIYQLANEPIESALPLYKEGFESNNLYTRQAIATTLQKVPKELQTEFESLLFDASYVTNEAALYVLWANFPENRAQYLDATAQLVGFQNKNIRLLWLALAINTQGYTVAQRANFITELRGYTSADFSFEIRQKAFEYINETQLYNETVLANLVNACTHHNWRFRNFARTLLAEVLKNPDMKESLQQQMNSFSTSEKAYLSQIME